jgi:hypothetical protein
MRRSPNRGLMAITVCLACTFFADVAPSLYAEDADSKKPALDAIIRRLAEQERLVRSCECLLSYRTDPSSPKMIPLIEEELRKHPRRGGFIFTRDDAARRTYVAHWWRHGIKERFDQFPTFDDLARPGAKPTRVSACDGKFIRSYNIHEKPNPVNGAMIEGTIKPGNSGLDFNHDYPFSLLYEYGNEPYSKLLAHAREAQVSEAAGRTTVTFTHPRFKDKRFKLVFGPDGSLLERDHITQMRRVDPAPRIYSRSLFFGYRTYRAASGESIRFPSEVDDDYVLGTTDDGQLIVYRHTHIQVNSLQFNHQIPDDVFVIEFPDECIVSDQTGGAGFAPAESKK